MKRRWRFTKKGSNSGSSKQKKQVSSDISSLKLYRSINELPLCRFIDAAVDDNLYALVISGTPNEIELLALWEKIKIEYADAMKDNEYKLYTNQKNELARLEITYNQLRKAIEELRKTYVAQFADKVNLWLRTSFKFDTRFPQDYENDLKRAANRSKGIKLEADLKRLNIEGLEKKFMDKGGKSTRESFMNILFTLSDHVKFQLSDNITVYEFCERVHRLNKYIEHLDTKPPKRR
jgi:hypothetical protein